MKGKKKIPPSQKQLDILRKGRENRKKNIEERKEKKKNKK